MVHLNKVRTNSRSSSQRIRGGGVVQVMTWGMRRGEVMTKKRRVKVEKSLTVQVGGPVCVDLQ